MQKVRQFVVNKTRVMADVTGTGEWLAGVVTATDRKNVTFQPDDGSEVVTIARTECYKPEDMSGEVPKSKGSTLNKDAEVVESADLDNDEDEDEELNGSVRIRPDHQRYMSHKNTPTQSGRDSYDTSDFVADVLRGMTIKQVQEITYKVLKQCEVETIGRGKVKAAVTRKLIAQRYSHLNLGMQRMCLGNLIRGTYRSLGVDPQEEMQELL